MKNHLIHIIIISCLISILSACNDSTPKEEGTKSHVTIEAPSKTVKQFYQNIIDKNCAAALLLRPKYRLERCKSLADIKLNAIREEYSDANAAIIYLNIDFTINKKPQHFNGFLWLKMINDRWQIQEGYTSSDKTTYQEYFDKYIAPLTSAPPLSSNKSNDIIDDNNHAILLAQLRKSYPAYASNNIILVDVSQQTLFLYRSDNKLITKYPVSTAIKGVGNQAGSDQTPLGAHVISNRFGDNAELGSIFIARSNTGRIAKILKQDKDTAADLVTSRILWLDGLEQGKNKGGNVDSHRRYIYIHGTQEEGLIGKPASHGCIRMKNKQVIELFQEAPVGTLVYIGE